MTAFLNGVNYNVETITFRCEAAKAVKVVLIGDFNGWNTEAHPMRREAGGTWSVQLPLTPGQYHYQFLIDGRPALDPHAMYRRLEERRGNVSFVAVD